jgi:hypothetical protein
MVELAKKRGIEDMSPAERELILKKPIGECSSEEKDWKLALLQERVDGIVAGQDLTKLGPEDLVWITVPLKPDGNLFEINLKNYYGRIKVQKRLAEELMYRISASYQMEKERLISRGNAPKDDRIRGEHQATIERFTQMMED